LFADFNFEDTWIESGPSTGPQRRTAAEAASSQAQGLLLLLLPEIHVAGRQKLGVPNYDDDDDKDIVIYKPPKQVSGTYADGDYFTTRTRDVCKPACMPNAKTAAEIREKTQVGTYAPSATLALQAWSTSKASRRLSLYIHSASEPYNEEMILIHERVDNNCLDKFSMERHPITHCSGHARSPADLFRIVTEIEAASVLFPVHTERPEMHVRANKKDGSSRRRGRDVHTL
jgi:hypothetical protein